MKIRFLSAPVHFSNLMMVLWIQLILLVVFSAMGQGRELTQGYWESQPVKGPGGNNYFHRKVRVTRGGNYNLFEPSSPTPRTAPLLIYISSKGLELAGLQEEMFRHLARKGIVVLQPVYAEEDGPSKGLQSIQDGMAELNSKGHVHPRGKGVAWGGYSSGGYMALYFAHHSEELGIGRTLAFIGHDQTPLTAGECFHSQFYTDFPIDLNEEIDSQALVLLTYTEETIRLSKETYKGISHHYSEWGLYENHPTDKKNFLRVNNAFYAGSGLGRQLKNTRKRLIADHFALLGVPGISVTLPKWLGRIIGLGSHEEVPLRVDPMDWNAYWRTTTAAVTCAFDGQDCDSVLGEGAKVKEMGRWLDGSPITPLSTPSEIPELNDPIRCPPKKK